MAHAGGNPHKIGRQVWRLGGVEAKTLSGAYTLLDSDAQELEVDCGGASRVMTLPAEEDHDGAWFKIKNVSDKGETIYVVNDAGDLVGIVRPGRVGHFGCDGSNWRDVGLVGAHNQLSRRYELRWTAGARGKPGLNADIQNAAEATREIADPDFELLGTNATSGSSAINAEGGVRLTTAGADGDEVILVPHLDASQSAWGLVTWGTDREVEWECFIKSGSNITNAIIWAGLKLTNTEVTVTDNDQVFFRYEDDVNSGKFQAIYSIGGTDTATDAAVTVATSTQYHLRISIDASRIARMYINDALVATSTALTDATDLIPYIGVAADGAAAAKSIDVYGQAISRIAGV
jgi:hypothetical protein